MVLPDQAHRAGDAEWTGARWLTVWRFRPQSRDRSAWNRKRQLRLGTSSPEKCLMRTSQRPWDRQWQAAAVETSSKQGMPGAHNKDNGDKGSEPDAAENLLARRFHAGWR